MPATVNDLRCGVRPDGLPKRVLVTGASGYVGGRLVPELLAAGYRVRVMTRRPGRLLDLPWADAVEHVVADARDADAMRLACDDVDIAYYLVHGLGASGDLAATEEVMASTVAEAARVAKVSRIVYLGGLGGMEADAAESAHLRSRARTAEILLASGVPTAALGAGIIIGSGSISFEMLRYLTERLPAMITPRWVRTRVQPIAIRDVLRYLVACAELPPEVNRSFDIAGPDVMSYEQLMHRYAAVAGLRPRIIVPVGVLTPGLSSRWIGLVTPVPAGIARPLVDSLRTEVVATEHDIQSFVPDPPSGLIPFDRAVELALTRIKEANVVSRWSSASVAGAPSDPLPTDPDWAGGSLYTDQREARVDCSAQSLWQVIEGIGGDNGWYSFPLAWEVRGLLDRAVGGPGLRRGRRDPRTAYVGEAIDFWRVEEREVGALLRLRAEMRLPGLAWLELAVSEVNGVTTYRQRAIFHPRGLAGHAYWWAVAPFHGIVFGSMVRRITAAARSLDGA